MLQEKREAEILSAQVSERWITGRRRRHRSQAKRSERSSRSSTTVRAFSVDVFARKDHWDSEADSFFFYGERWKAPKYEVSRSDAEADFDFLRQTTSTWSANESQNKRSVITLHCRASFATAQSHCGLLYCQHANGAIHTPSSPARA